MAFLATDLGQLLSVTSPTLPQLNVEVAGSDRPLALLPIRLETRFFTNADGTRELRVRVYPDKVHISAHDPSLTAEERLWGQRFWELHWKAGPDEARQRAAWQMLADRFDATRAAWIAQALQPRNPGDRPRQPIAETAAFATPPRFPVLPPPKEGPVPDARLLPDRWIATAYSGGTAVVVVTGRDIRSPLFVAPDLKKKVDPAAETGEAPAIDQGMRWMIDFDEAEATGMALRVPLPGAASRGIDLLVVAGVKASLMPTDSATQLADLLKGHHFTDGLAFVPPGTPSNNTASDRAGFSSADPRQERSFADEWRQPAFAAAADTNGAVAARALGLGAELGAAVFGRIAGASLRPHALAAAMQTALWPASWGYFLSQMIGFEGSGLDLGVLDWTRAHFINQVRPSGPLPTLRCGRQPYGLLPTTSLDLWSATPGDPDATRLAGLQRLLLALRNNVWRPAIGQAPRVGRSDDARADLADVLRVSAASLSASVRGAMGHHYLQHLRAFLGETLDATFWAKFDELGMTLPRRLGYGFKPRLANVAFDEAVRPIVAPLVQGGDIAEGQKLSPNYISELLGARVDDLANPVPADRQAPLLKVLLRHAYLRQQAEAAARVHGRGGADAAALLRDQELVDLMPAPAPTPSWKWQRAQRVAAVTGTRTVGEFLDTLADFSDPSVRALGEFKASLQALGTSDVVQLERELRTALGSAGYRLDAWVTSLATRRLAELRQKQAEGIVIGAYGWVEQLRPTAARTIVPPPAGEAAPIEAPADDPGFIHAPSLNQAATAALLRNGHLSHGAAPDGPLAIELNSTRVRLAQSLLDGVRQGQPLSALLGYRFERRLHDARLDPFIATFRTIAPGAAPTEVGTAEPTRQMRAVVNGLDLRQLWKDQREKLLRERVGIQEMHPSWQRLVDALDALDEALDAVADAVSAESVHQFVRGNMMRAGATLSAIASGQAPAPELEFARTPRTGITLTHRVAAVFAAGAATATGWAAPAQSPRAAAEPVLEAWAARLLGRPDAIICRIEQLDPGGGGVVKTHVVKLSELALGALDLVFSSGKETGSASDAELLVLHRLRLREGPSLKGAVLRLAPGRVASAPPTERALDDALEIAASLKRLLGKTRPLDGADLQPPAAALQRGIAIAELEARALAAEKGLARAHAALTALLKTMPALTALENAMLALGRFGVAGTVPVGEDGGGIDRLLAQASAVAGESARRVAQLAGLPPSPQSDPPDARRDRALQRLRAAFGTEFVALPRFAYPGAADLAGSLADNRTLLGADPFAPYTWFQRMERVREPLTLLGLVLREAEAVGSAETLRLGVAQLPRRAGERWVGMPMPPGKIMPDGSLSLILQGAEKIDFTKPLAGLLVDEWVEVVPSRSETTGIAFQFDPPDTCAPQAILLAVPPVPGKAWTVGTLNRVLIETFELARMRAIDPAALGDIAHFLPALHFAFNVDGDAVATDFSGIAPP
jgi:hypothetical protein